MTKSTGIPDDLGLVPDSAPGMPPGTGRRRAYCGDLGMRIDRDGTWYYHGSPIGRKELVRLFASVLTRGSDGNYWLVTPAEMGRLQVDDVPFVAVELFVSGKGRDTCLSLRTNIDQIVAVDCDHPIRVSFDTASGEPTPYVTVRDGIEARIVRSVYYELVDLGVEESVDHDDVYGVWSSGHFFTLGRLDDAS